MNHEVIVTVQIINVGETSKPTKPVNIFSSTTSVKRYNNFGQADSFANRLITAIHAIKALII